MDGGNGKKTSRVPVRWLVAVSLLIGIAIAVAWLSIHAPRGVALLKHFKEYLDGLQNDEHKRIGLIIFDNYNEYRADTRNWSAVTFGSLFLSAALSACAGVILKLEFFLRNEPFKKDLAAILAMMAALLVTLSTVGGFHQRWTSNRLAAAKMERLAYLFMALVKHPISQFFQIRSRLSPLNEMRGSSQLNEMTGQFQTRASAKPNSSLLF